MLFFNLKMFCLSLAGMGMVLAFQGQGIEGLSAICFSYFFNEWICDFFTFEEEL